MQNASNTQIAQLKIQSVSQVPVNVPMIFIFPQMRNDVTNSLSVCTSFHDLKIEKQFIYYNLDVNDFCETYIGCRDLKFTSCSQNNKCTCLSTHLEINGHCRGVMNSPCFENDDCAAINAICDKSNTCQCPSEFYRSTTELECYPFANSKSR